MTDDVDVVVTDGFTGNVVLKTLEGGDAVPIINALLAAFADADVQEHADALLPALLPLYETLDPDTYGGAMLLGVDGVCIISHGSTGRAGDAQRHQGGPGDGRATTWSPRSAPPSAAAEPVAEPTTAADGRG